MIKNDRKICLVTGANSGIGKEIAIGLAKSGAHVIMVCRDLDRAQAALEDIKIKSGSSSIDLLIADLSSQADIRSLAKIMYERYSALHILINNAGLVLSKRTLSADGIEMTLATNHLGPFLLTHLLLDLLEKSTPSRIINVSSAIQKWAKINLTDLQYENHKYQFMKVYGQSKLLMNIITFEFAKRLEGTGVTINCIHPGAVKTSLGSDNSHHIALKCIDKLIKFFFITPKQAAKNILDLAISPEWESISGKYVVKGKAVLSNLVTYDRLLAKKIWGISERFVGYRSSNNP